jgi:hypothetical protein
MDVQEPIPDQLADQPVPLPGQPVPRRRAPHRILFGIALHAVWLLIGIGAYVAHGHYAMQGRSTASLVSLVAAAGFGLIPLRGLLRAFLDLEGKVLHLVHGVAGLGVVGLTAGGVVSSGPLMTHAAMAPFAIMGAAQALMHQDHPRNAAQAAALRNFATSLPEVAQFTKSGDLASPANAQRAVTVLTDLVSKAEALGETELQADPGFQSALRQATTRVGLSLGVDAIDRALGTLASNPATASVVPALQKRLDALRKTPGS